MRHIKLLCVITICTLNYGYAQVLENVKSTFSGDKVIITYDLTSTDPTQKFKIAAYSAHDNYAAPLQYVTGAVGENVSPGKGLKIEWDAKSSLPADFNGIISVKLRGVGIPLLKGTEQTVYKKGNILKVMWAGGGKADKMNIELVRDGKVVETLEASAENTSSFDWKIPNKTKKGKDYSIRLTDVTDPMQPTTTNTFEIKPKIPLLVKLAPIVIAGGVIAILQSGGGGKGPDADDTLPAITVKPN